MSTFDKQVSGTGWLELEGFGLIALRRDDVSGGRQYFTIKTSAGGYPSVVGETVTGGQETWYFDFDMPFHVMDESKAVLEMVISLLPGGVYCVKYGVGDWPQAPVGGGWVDSE